MVAMVRSVRRTGNLRLARPVKACGVVTSWIKCRSIYNIVGSPLASRTTCASHIFSYNVCPAPLEIGRALADFSARLCCFVLVFLVFIHFLDDARPGFLMGPSSLLSWFLIYC